MEHRPLATPRQRTQTWAFVASYQLQFCISAPSPASPLSLTWQAQRASVWEVRLRVRSFGRIWIEIFDLYVAFFSSKSIFRSGIYRIHSRQGFIGSLIWVILKRIIGSMIRRVPLGKGSEIKHCPSAFGLNYTGTSYIRCISVKFPAYLHTASVLW